MTCSDI